MSTGSGSFGAVIVTFNRVDKLKKALAAIEGQDVLPQYVVVVNNASTDKTAEYLDEWKGARSLFERIVIHMEHNEGGSGGFFAGLQKALTLAAEWIYVSDDDAYPCENAFRTFQDYIDTHDNTDVSAVCGTVVQYGKIAVAHRRRITRRCFNIVEKAVPEAEYQQESFSCDCYSFVGVFLHREKLRAAGLPIKEYFIQWDDTEHSIRMSREGSVICVPDIRVDHDLEYSSHAGYQWKDYYGIRNRMDGIKRNFPLRYSIAMALKRGGDILQCWLKPDKEFARLLTSASVDAWRGRLGVHPVYKPGWKPKQDRE